MKRFLALACLAVTACGISTTRLQPTIDDLEYPPLNEVRSAELGDTIVSAGRVYTYDGIDLQNEVTAGDGFLTPNMVVPPQKLRAEIESKSWIFYRGKAEIGFPTSGMNESQGGLAISKSSGSLQVWAGAVNSGRMAKPNNEPVYRKMKVRVAVRDGFQQELIYNGRSRNNVKFLYREVQDDMLRAPFSQNVQYDLTTNHIVGFKGARIEILSASNTTLRYKVLARFRGN